MMEVLVKGNGKMRIIDILEILKKYHIDDAYPLWAEHDVIGFYVDYEEISQEDKETLEELGCFYNEEYGGLTIYC